ncbi:MAG: hypothetical protein ABIS86_04455, partial [Streptosporangiaceae bacterium]
TMLRGMVMTTTTPRPRTPQPLQRAVLVEELLCAGADPDRPLEECGWLFQSRRSLVGRLLGRP